LRSYASPRTQDLSENISGGDSAGDVLGKDMNAAHALVQFGREAERRQSTVAGSITDMSDLTPAIGRPVARNGTHCTKALLCYLELIEPEL
jgi:hypothetical protein